jgi:hypothetical protein
VKYTFPVKDTYDNTRCNGIASDHSTMKTVTCSNWNTFNEGNNIDDEYGTIGNNVIISKVTTDSGKKLVIVLLYHSYILYSSSYSFTNISSIFSSY